MTICDYSQNIEITCTNLQAELLNFLRLLPALDQIKVGSGDHEPTWTELSGLWDGCLTPPASMVFWHNTDTDTVSWWVSPIGDYYEEI